LAVLLEELFEPRYLLSQFLLATRGLRNGVFREGRRGAVGRCPGFRVQQRAPGGGGALPRVVGGLLGLRRALARVPVAHAGCLRNS
jgi:hypothetical protein